ncbi:hypothetical protein [Caulobacter sp. 17J80-11]|nr:hypothetical protein [Caulobacter sp. 17J80-11]MBC6983290.1 hypothetical protein [Caulobacter sp. 17J80-11]
MPAADAEARQPLAWLAALLTEMAAVWAPGLTAPPGGHPLEPGAEPETDA